MRRRAAAPPVPRYPEVRRHRAAVLAALLAGSAMALTFAPTAHADTRSDRPQPLAELFDNVGISDDAAPEKADFDGNGASFSAQDLDTAGWAPGTTVTLNRTPLTVPASTPGTPDNVVADGQSVRLTGRGDAVTFLVAGTGGYASGTGRIVYRDGSRADFTLTAPDWRSGPLTTKALALPHVNTPDGRADAKLRLFPVTTPADPRREVLRVELPGDVGGAARLHVFALGLRTPAADRTGIWSTSTSGYAPVGPWRDQTVRMVVHAGAGGHAPRLRFDNTFAAEPVEIGAATVAVRRKGAAAERRPVKVTFGRSGSVRVPAGGQVFSDPVGFRIPAQTDLLVSFHLPGPISAAPVHTAAAGTNYLSAAGSGDVSGESGGGSFTEPLTVWPFLTGVDVQRGPGSVVAFGDSITDGVGSTPDTARRWPDVLSDRLDGQSQVPRFGVLNQGISANRVVTDRYDGDGVSTDTGGVKAVDRVDRDVLAQPGVRTLVMFEGVNDVRAGSSAEEVSAGMRDIAERSREQGVRVLAATIVPCGGYKDCTSDVDARRERINAFIRANSGPGETFDALLDFDAVVRDPAAPERLLPEYDSGDHLHPGDAGLAAIAESIDLRLLDPADAL